MFREGGTRPANKNKPPCVSAEGFDEGYIMVDDVKKKQKKNTQMVKLLPSVIFHTVQTRV